jgi:hypothetical protein
MPVALPATIARATARPPFVKAHADQMAHFDAANQTTQATKN